MSETQWCAACRTSYPVKGPWHRCALDASEQCFCESYRGPGDGLHVRKAALLEAMDDLGWTGLPVYAIAYAAAIRDVQALLGTPAHRSDCAMVNWKYENTPIPACDCGVPA